MTSAQPGGAAPFVHCANQGIDADGLHVDQIVPDVMQSNTNT